MWFKLCLLLFYIIVLFVLARLVEALTWYENGSLSRRLLDPMTLSVAKLKALLEQRGVSYDYAVEKTVLTKLVEGSGSVHEDDLDEIQSGEDDTDCTDTNFSSGSHFYEKVEDAKDSVWLVQVIASHQQQPPRPLLSDVSWTAIRKKVTKYGVHTGILSCHHDRWWCENRGWHSPHLLLALPQFYKAKTSIAIHIYDGPLYQNAITEWIQEKLHNKIEEIHDFQQLNDEWLTFKNNWLDSEVRVLLFTNESSIPTFFSALSVKFPGRIKFGIVRSSSDMSLLEWTASSISTNASSPLYLILFTEGSYMYGKNRGDCLTFSSFKTLLKFLHPCVNDIFIFTLIMANIISFLEFFISHGTLLHRIRRLLWYFIKYNMTVIGLWLPLTTLYHLPIMESVTMLGLKLSRILSTSVFGDAVRRDIFFFAHHPYQLATCFILTCMLFQFIANKTSVTRDTENNDVWFSFNNLRTLVSLHTNEIFDPLFTNGFNISNGRFFSSLEHASMNSSVVVFRHYIDHLPTWPYNAGCVVWQCPYKHCTKLEHAVSDDCLSYSGRPLRVSSNSACARPASANDLLDGNYRCECQVYSGVGYAAASISGIELSDFTVNHPERALTDSPAQHIHCTDADLIHAPAFAAAGNPEVSECLARSDSCHGAPGGGFPHIGYLVSPQCVVCLEEYCVGVMLCGLPCRHVFHHSCILTWLKSDHDICPVCRWPACMPLETPPGSFNE